MEITLLSTLTSFPSTLSAAARWALPSLGGVRGGGEGGVTGFIQVFDAAR